MCLAVVVALLAEQSLPTPKVFGLNPLIGKILCRKCIYCSLLKMTKNKEKHLRKMLNMNI